jgi:hypothetical protein
VGQAGAAPVLAQHQYPAHLPELRQDARVLGPDRRLVERVDEPLAVDGHVVDVLLEGHALLESFSGHHSGYPITGI